MRFYNLLVLIFNFHFFKYSNVFNFEVKGENSVEKMGDYKVTRFSVCAVSSIFKYLFTHLLSFLKYILRQMCLEVLCQFPRECVFYDFSNKWHNKSVPDCQVRSLLLIRVKLKSLLLPSLLSTLSLICPR